MWISIIQRGRSEADPHSFGNMAKPFAEKLYNSEAWHKVRELAMIRDKGLCQCEGCCRPAEEVHHIVELTPENVDDPEVALNLDNLISVCKDCHFRIHREKILKSFRRRARKKILDRNGCYFDGAGMLRQMRVHIVYGSPGSGKNTYVEQNRDATDLVVDLDAIQQAVGHARYADANNLLDLTLHIREGIYDLIEKRDPMIDCRNVWVIATLPKKEERRQLADRLRADLIHIDTSQRECMKRVMNDPDRTDKQIAKAIVEEYFEKFQP